MKKLVLLRHGESEWNKENRFTGWTDVDLSEQGQVEAQQAGKLLKAEGYSDVLDLVLNMISDQKPFPDLPHRERSEDGAQ